LGDLLVGAKLVTVQDVADGLKRQANNGLRLGTNLVELGVIGQKALDAFLKRIPSEPADIAATKIDGLELM